jgi:phosphoglycerate dehydrogenase-like enzyme
MILTRATGPRLLIFGEPPKAWFDAAAGLHELADVQLAEEGESDSERVRDAEILFFWEQSQRRLRDLWPHARSLRWVHSSSAGVEKLVFPALAESPVIATNGRGLYADPLAEFVLFSALFFAKNFPAMEENRRERRWQRYNPRELLGATMGIVGFGGTGRATARLAKAFGMQVLALKRRPATAEDHQLADRFVPSEARNELLAQSDYVVNALPLTPETSAYFDETAFRAMKAGACFMNVGRGGTVDEEALIRALRQGRIAAAGLDVFQREPLPAESEFYRLPNVIVSPHSADLTERYPARSAQFFLKNVKRYVNREPLLNIVDKSRGY